jgi:predicted metal-dependent peptidase
MTQPAIQTPATGSATPEAPEPFNLNQHTARLLMREPFFAAISRRIDKRASRGVPTAGVKVDPETGKFVMYYNPEFFESLTSVQRLGVLKHEFYHLIFEHVTGRLPTEGMSKDWNIATDLSINSHLMGELPDFCCFPGQGPFESLPLGKSAEWYYANLPEKDEAGDPEDGEGQGADGEGEGEEGPTQGDSFDDHSGWGDADQATREIAKERLKNDMRKAADEASRANNWGTISSETRKEIMDRLTPKVDWKKVLRYFVKTTQRTSRTSTVKRLNRRYPRIHSGKKVQRTARIAISVDQSGSVSDAMLAAFFTELNTLASLAEFTVVPFDTEVAVDNVFVWKKGQSKVWERVMCGGTCFDAPTRYVNNEGFDGHIVLTDMMAPKPIASDCQRMWMTTKEYAARPYFQTNERVIAIDCEG